MTLPFIRQLPGRRVLQEISLPPEVENIGREFIQRGGRYLIEVLPLLGSPNVRVVACILDDDEQVDLVEETVENVPGLVAAVNRVVSASLDLALRVSGTKH